MGEIVKINIKDKNGEEKSYYIYSEDLERERLYHSFLENLLFESHYYNLKIDKEFIEKFLTKFPKYTVFKKQLIQISLK